MAEARLGVVANPLINITIQGRHDTYPKRRGMTRVPELMAAGLTIAFGHDCVMDPWYSLGSADMLEVAGMAVHVAQMTGLDAMRRCFDAVTSQPAELLGLDGYGVAPGCHADLVLLEAQDPIEAIRTRRHAPRQDRGPQPGAARAARAPRTPAGDRFPAAAALTRKGTGVPLPKRRAGDMAERECSHVHSVLDPQGAGARRYLWPPGRGTGDA
jgi:cytosine/adenosine deaminase-related metal-dependent hydrolase